MNNFISNYDYKKYGNIQLHTIGCELSSFDTLQFAKLFNPNDKIIILNTCSFLREKDFENKLIFDILSNTFTDYKIIVIGCGINYNREKYKNCETYTNDDLRKIIKNKKLPKLYDNYENNIKIQDGCNKKCAYCIINQLRKNPISLSYNSIVKSIKENIEILGQKEIFLTGTEICNYYDNKMKYHLSELLLHLINDIPMIEKIKMYSLYPESPQVEKVIDIISEYPQFDKHITLSVQSGSNKILKLMNRNYTADRIREIMMYAKKKHITVGWEIIVGFPGETNELFNETFELFNELKPIKNSIFEYSLRENTLAFNMENQIDDKIKHLRFNVLNNFDNELLNKNNVIDTKELLNNFDKINYLDIFDENSLKTFLKTENNQPIIIKYDESKSLDSQIIINFIHNFKKGLPIIVEIFDSDNIKKNEFENKFGCGVIIRKR